MVTLDKGPLPKPPETSLLIKDVARALGTTGQMMCTAESCTGGLIAARCTDLAGSSAWFERGFVTYSNAAKQELLEVPPDLLAQYGAVSEPVARAMAQGALLHAKAQWAIAVTGVAGPSGGSRDKPVGTVWIAWAGPGCLNSVGFLFDGDRQRIRQQTVDQALWGLLERLTDSSREF
jgi:nicotinamide-nucleotide amidase